MGQRRAAGGCAVSRPAVYNDGTGDGLREFAPKASRKALRDLTPAALEGYAAGRMAADRNAAPHLATSPNWYAWQAGYYMAWRGMPEPSDVRMGRGDLVRVRDLVFRVTVSKAGTRIEREA